MRKVIALVNTTVVLGQGIALFDGTVARTGLDLKATKRFASGVVALHYALKRT